MMGTSSEKLEGVMGTELFPFLRKPNPQESSGFLKGIFSSLNHKDIFKILPLE